MARRYAFARGQPVAGHPLASFFRRDVTALARAAVAARPEALLVRASTGAPGWASVPWLAWFAPHVTRSMKRGLYVAVFINARDERIVLSLQHGAADILRDHGPVEGLRHLRAMAEATRGAVGGFGHRGDDGALDGGGHDDGFHGVGGSGFIAGPVRLGSPAPLPQGYEAGCALSRSWGADDPGLAEFETALARMLDLYRALSAI